MAYSGGAGLPSPTPGLPQLLGPPTPQGVTSRPPPVRPPKPPGVKPPRVKPPGVKPPGVPPVTPSPLDSTYYMNVAQNQFATNNKINALNLQGANAGTSLQGALAQLAYQQPRDALRAEQSANQRGALYSTPYQQQQGDLANSYLQRQGSDITNFQQGQSARASEIAALQGGEGLYALREALAASLRASQRAARNPAQGESNKPLGRAPGHTGHPPAGRNHPGAGRPPRPGPPPRVRSRTPQGITSHPPPGYGVVSGSG